MLNLLGESEVNFFTRNRKTEDKKRARLDKADHLQQPAKARVLMRTDRQFEIEQRRTSVASDFEKDGREEHVGVDGASAYERMSVVTAAPTYPKFGTVVPSLWRER
ncbi:hypothetical protein E4U59_007095 [Claviceps monticola]|nr:hypothetical protein E4U59_007095 [Claviceps monticola]